MKVPIRVLPQKHAVKIWDLYFEYLRRYLWKTDFTYNSKLGFMCRKPLNVVLQSRASSAVWFYCSHISEYIKHDRLSKSEIVPLLNRVHFPLLCFLRSEIWHSNGITQSLTHSTKVSIGSIAFMVSFNPTFNNF